MAVDPLAPPSRRRLRPGLASLAVHTERLHDPRVWRNLSFGLRAAGGPLPVTFFSVAPLHQFYRTQHHFDEGLWVARLQALAGAGHEIQLHTHFYAGDGRKVLDATPDHVARCLERDARFLRCAGFRVEGFVSGAWTVTPQLWKLLVANDIKFDASLRSYDRPNGPPSGEGILVEPEVREGGRLLLVPTTADLRRAISRQQPTIPAAGYGLVYLHDYDFLRPVKVLAFILMVKTWRRHLRWVPASELARTIRLDSVF